MSIPDVTHGYSYQMLPMVTRTRCYPWLLVVLTRSCMLEFSHINYDVLKLFDYDNKRTDAPIKSSLDIYIRIISMSINISQAYCLSILWTFTCMVTSA